MSDEPPCERVLVTGAAGFVGRYVVRELLDRGHHVVALVRSPGRLDSVLTEQDRDRVTIIRGTLFDRAALREAVSDTAAVIHLVGIITEAGKGQTFDRVHRQGTEKLARAAVAAGVRRFVHMSALGTRNGAASAYHRSKWAAEECVRGSILDWTIFRPSVIHGPDGDFMQLMKTFACGLLPPVMPYFGSGNSRLQPIAVQDVAACFAEALQRPNTIGRCYELGGPTRYTWRQLYGVCKRMIPGARRWKPRVGQPVIITRLLAATLMKTPLVPPKLRFNKAQVQMSQEDSICDHTIAEADLGLRFRDFETELADYAARIR